MKEIKAYVRPELLEAIIEQLEGGGAQDITVIRVDALGKMADAAKDPLALGHSYHERYSKMAKLEIICRDGEAETFVRIIREAGRLGESGDGRIFVTGVEAAVNIRTGAEGDEAL